MTDLPSPSPEAVEAARSRHPDGLCFMTDEEIAAVLTAAYRLDMARLQAERDSVIDQLDGLATTFNKLSAEEAAIRAELQKMTVECAIWKDLVEGRNRQMEAWLLERDALKSRVTELERALEEIAIGGEQGMRPSYTSWLTFHDKVAAIAHAALGKIPAQHTYHSRIKDGLCTDCGVPKADHNALGSVRRKE